MVQILYVYNTNRVIFLCILKYCIILRVNLESIMQCPFNIVFKLTVLCRGLNIFLKNKYVGFFNIFCNKKIIIIIKNYAFI
jgi:hypothetical protein